MNLHNFMNNFYNLQNEWQLWKGLHSTNQQSIPAVLNSCKCCPDVYSLLKIINPGASCNYNGGRKFFLYNETSGNVTSLNHTLWS